MKVPERLSPIKCSKIVKTLDLDYLCEVLIDHKCAINNLRDCVEELQLHDRATHEVDSLLHKRVCSLEEADKPEDEMDLGIAGNILREREQQEHTCGECADGDCENHLLNRDRACEYFTPKKPSADRDKDLIWHNNGWANFKKHPWVLMCIHEEIVHDKS